MLPLTHEPDVRPEVAAALADGLPVVALESTLIAHGLPHPDNLYTARAAEAAVRAAAAVPATIAVIDGRPTIGLGDDELERLANDTSVRKASRRDLAAAVALRQTAATTVAATMALAEIAGIRVFATGGIGGAHRVVGWWVGGVVRSGVSPRGERSEASAPEPPHHPTTAPPHVTPTWDVSADLDELSRTRVAVVCAGAKSILDIPRTLEILETLGVPVVGYGCDQFPGFYLPSTGEPVSARVDDPATAARLLAAHWGLGGAGAIIAQPVAAEIALEPTEFDAALARAEQEARTANVRGPAVTPFLLARLAEQTSGRSLQANKALIVANARLAAEIATALAHL
jgi:pseudouridine-5'-phosphate glycosidase